MKGSMNTGRKYSPEGQIIEYEVKIVSEIFCDAFSQFLVDITFNDKTRSIAGRIDQQVVFDEPNQRVIEGLIIHCYDNGMYKDI